MICVCDKHNHVADGGIWKVEWIETREDQALASSCTLGIKLKMKIVPRPTFQPHYSLQPMSVDRRVLGLLEREREKREASWPISHSQ